MLLQQIKNQFVAHQTEIVIVIFIVENVKIIIIKITIKITIKIIIIKIIIKITIIKITIKIIIFRHRNQRINFDFFLIKNRRI